MDDLGRYLFAVLYDVQKYYLFVEWGQKFMRYALNDIISHIILMSHLSYHYLLFQIMKDTTVARHTKNKELREDKLYLKFLLRILLAKRSYSMKFFHILVKEFFVYFP